MLAQDMREGRVERNGWRVGQSQPATAASRSSSGAPARLLGPGENLPSLVEKHAAGFGQRHAALAALQQTGAQIPLQRLDLLRQRRLGNVQADRGAGEAQFLGDGDEVA